MQNPDQLFLNAANLKKFISEYTCEVDITQIIIFLLYNKIKTMYIYNIKRALWTEFPRLDITKLIMYNVNVYIVHLHRILVLNYLVCLLLINNLVS